jgi:hypothetical protein
MLDVGGIGEVDKTHDAMALANNGKEPPELWATVGVPDFTSIDLT